MRYLMDLTRHPFDVPERKKDGILSKQLGEAILQEVVKPSTIPLWNSK